MSRFARFRSRVSIWRFLLVAIPLLLLALLSLLAIILTLVADAIETCVAEPGDALSDFAMKNRRSRQ